MKTIALFTHMGARRTVRNTNTEVTMSGAGMATLTMRLIPLDATPDTTQYKPSKIANSIFVLGVENDILTLLHYGKDTLWSKLSPNDFKRFCAWHSTAVHRNSGNGDVQISGIQTSGYINAAFFCLYPDLVYPTNTQILNIRIDAMLAIAPRVEWNSTFRPMGPKLHSYLLQTDDVRVYWVNSTHKEVYDLTDIFHNKEWRDRLNDMSVPVPAQGFSYPGYRGDEFSAHMKNRELLLADFFSSNVSYDLCDDLIKSEMVSPAHSNKAGVYTLSNRGLWARMSLSRDQFSMLERHCLGLETRTLYMSTPVAEAYFLNSDSTCIYLRARRNSGVVSKPKPKAPKPVAVPEPTPVEEVASIPEPTPTPVTPVTPEPIPVKKELVPDTEYTWPNTTILSAALGSVKAVPFLLAGQSVWNLELGNTYRTLLWVTAIDSEVTAMLSRVPTNYIVSTMNETWVKIDGQIYYAPMHVNPVI